VLSTWTRHDPLHRKLFKATNVWIVVELFTTPKFLPRPFVTATVPVGVSNNWHNVVLCANLYFHAQVLDVLREFRIISHMIYHEKREAFHFV
jgi:hypothetical protein